MLKTRLNGRLTPEQHVAMHPRIEAPKLTSAEITANMTMHHIRDTIVFNVEQLSTAKSIR